MDVKAPVKHLGFLTFLMNLIPGFHTVLHSGNRNVDDANGETTKAQWLGW